MRSVRVAHNRYSKVCAGLTDYVGGHRIARPAQRARRASGTSTIVSSSTSRAASANAVSTTGWARSSITARRCGISTLMPEKRADGQP